jgi:hypothetical protein
MNCPILHLNENPNKIFLPPYFLTPLTHIYTFTGALLQFSIHMGNPAAQTEVISDTAAAVVAAAQQTLLPLLGLQVLLQKTFTVAQGLGRRVVVVVVGHLAEFIIKDLSYRFGIYIS